jgi:cardiolipin synthase A/B
MRLILVVIVSFLCSGCGNVPEIERISNLSLSDPAFYATVSAHLDAPMVRGNRVEILLNGEEIFPAMLKAIASARKSITYAQYLYKGGTIAREFAEAFAERCRAGVEVKLLIDSHGGGDMPKDIPELWKRSGCDLKWFRRIKMLQFITPWELLDYNYRNHRRVLVIDGKIGFTGGNGVSDAWTGDGRTRGHWRDTDVRVEGPVVRQLQSAFVESWRETTGSVLGGKKYFPQLEGTGTVDAQIVKSSPLAGSFDTYLMFLMSIAAAQKSIYITNPYFLPGDRLTDALVAAASRGVEVLLLTPGKLDWSLVHRASRHDFGPLLRGGVRIFEYQTALMHAKTMVVDGLLATVGSTNLDNRSFALNEEVNFVARDQGIARQLEKVFKDDLEHSREINYQEWKSRPLIEKMLELFTIPIEEEL